MEFFLRLKCFRFFPMLTALCLCLCLSVCLSVCLSLSLSLYIYIYIYIYIGGLFNKKRDFLFKALNLLTFFSINIS